MFEAILSVALFLAALLPNTGVTPDRAALLLIGSGIFAVSARLAFITNLRYRRLKPKGGHNNDKSQV